MSNVDTNENLPGARRAEQDAGGGEQKSQADLEALARRNGWRPKDEFRGKGDWVDAGEYLRRNEEHLPIIKGRLVRAEAEVGRLSTETAALREEVRAGNTALEQSREATFQIKEMLTSAEQRGYDRAVKEAGAKMDAAIEAGDVPAAQAARKELETVTAEAAARAAAAAKPAAKKTEDVTPQPQKNPDATAWIAAPEQSWYREIRGAKGWAEQLFVDDSMKHLSIKDRLAEITKLAAEEFGGRHPTHFKTADGDAEPDPEKEDKPVRRSAVGTPRSPGGGRGNNEPTFEDIPLEAQRLYEVQRRDIEAHAKAKGTKTTFTKDEYLQAYKAAGGEFKARG